ncbi:penicillin-insensitive murein endopeptidase [Massilia sp. KIM]|uniref:penicillin-insensitive murein endopeptidase n=1 Tax=Massilia sp. KIM TaxID=1955422 RepID=UPI0015C36B26|nr:penicillin-insensitive murein endopeptidase [Massilia sp. KIM]
MIPQAPEGCGYYTYGTPTEGRAQYADPRLITLLLAVERAWTEIDKRRFGVGNISKAEGVAYGHESHKNGLQVDVRPLRKDGRREPVSCAWPQYDREGTRTLVELFRRFSPRPLVILFNDLHIPGVKYWDKHNDHLHIALK